MKYSQNDEEEILSGLIPKIPDIGYHSCEFGMNGTQNSNTYHLAEKGWKCTYIEKDLDRLKPIPNSPNITKLNRLVTYSNINKILKEAELPIHFDILSIDIDGGDGMVWKGTTQFQPKIVIIEFNPYLQIDKSFQPMIDIGYNKGYSLYTQTGGNLIFVDSIYKDKVNLYSYQEAPNGFVWWKPHKNKTLI